MRGCVVGLLVLLLVAALLTGVAYLMLEQTPALAAGTTPVPVSSTTPCGNCCDRQR